MEVFLLLALFFGIKFLYGIWKTGKEERERLSKVDCNANLYTEAKQELENKKIMEETKGTRDLFMETLTKIGCQYELSDEKDDDRIFFAYQGEHLFAEAQNDAKFVHVYDPNWYQVELYDIDKFASLKKVINEANMNFYTTTFYTINEAGSTVDVHCRVSLVFIPELPQIDDYLTSILNNFFRVHQYVNNEMAKLIQQEEQVKS